MVRRGRGAHAQDLRERGANALEFALIAPILILLLLGIVDFGRGYNAQVTLTHAAREGARECSFGNDGAAAATAAAGGYGSDPSFGASCDNTCATPGDPATVTVNYTFDFITPLPFGPIAMSESATQRCGG